jgi:3-phenylpropionate/trans-cinnamate dioxygenase ferredoxin reductase subunit
LVTRVVIVGGGHAAAQLVSRLRQMKFSGEVRLLTEEQHLPYNRPPLSKGFLSGEIEKDRLRIFPEAVYAKVNCEISYGAKVTGIDPAGKTVVLADGETVPYDKLALAMGAIVHRLRTQGSELAGIHYVRTIDDIEALRADIAPGRKMVVIGGGYIGLEVAAVARKLGLEVTVLEAAERILQRVCAPQVSAFYADIHRQEGVTIECDTMVASLEGEGRVSQVVAKDGRRFAADVVVVGIGIAPNDGLARDAGLDCDNGISVDEFCRSSDVDIFAAGDCASHPNAIYGRRMRLESVQNAADQAKTIAGVLCDRAAPYADLPWFWSDQYDLNLQIAGVAGDYDQVVVRGDGTDRKIAFFYLRDGKVQACDAVNMPAEFNAAKRMILDAIDIPPAQLMDTSIPIKELL